MLLRLSKGVVKVCTKQKLCLTCFLSDNNDNRNTVRYRIVYIFNITFSCYIRAWCAHGLLRPAHLLQIALAERPEGHLRWQVYPGTADWPIQPSEETSNNMKRCSVRVWLLPLNCMLKSGSAKITTADLSEWYSTERTVNISLHSWRYGYTPPHKV